jgi:amphi-Trp domain-containing protein
MPEIETQAVKSRTEVAEYLRKLADQLDGGGDMLPELGGRSVTVNPTEPLVLELEGEWDPTVAAATESIEFELVWGPDADTEEAGSSTQ